MQNKDLFQLSNNKANHLSKSSVTFLITAQVLLVVLVITGVFFTTKHLKEVALNNMEQHALIQTQSLQDRLDQSFSLLHLNLRHLITEHPEAINNETVLLNALISLLTKLNFLRSVSVMDAEGKIFLSTNPKNQGVQVNLGQQYPDVSNFKAGVLLFSEPWLGRDFIDGQPLSQSKGQLHQNRNFFPVTLVIPEATQWTLLLAINSDYFINLAPEPKNPEDLIYRIHLDNGQLLFFTSATNFPAPEAIPKNQLHQILHKHQGSFFWNNTENKQQLTSYRVSYNHPWFIYTQASSNYILKQWREDTEKLWVVTGLTLIIILIIGSLMTRKIQKSLHHEELNLERNQLAAYVFLYTNDLIVIANKNKKIIAVNPAFEKATGYNASEVLGTRPSGQSRELERKFYTNLWQALEKQTNWQGEVTQHRKDGSDITGWLQVSVIHDQQGKIVNYLGVLKDLSSLREHESLIHKLNLAVEQSPSSIVITNPNAEIEYANPQLLNSSGYSLEEVLGENPSKFQSKHTPTQTYKNLWQQISNGKVWQGEFINQRKTGDIYIERCTISPIFNSQAEISGYLGIKHDVTSEKEAEQALRLAASVIESTSEGVMICDANQKIIQINPAFSRITGYSIHEVSGRNPKMLAAEQRNDAIHTLMKATLTEQNSWEGEFWNRHKNGALYVVHSSISLIKDENDSITHYISVFSDITQTKQHLANLEKQAHFDPLTGLPNRILLNIRLEQALTLASQNKSWLAVGFIDLDGFKAVNDSQGHQAGDELLIMIAERLTHSLREQDTVARLGGDEFIILLKVHSLEECQNIAQRLLDIIAEPIPLSTGCLAKVTGSLGLTLYPQDKGDAAQLLRHADHAMYEAKQGGRNRFVISKKALNS